MDQDKRTLDFLRLFVRHQQEIYTYILILVPHEHDADDLFQDGMAVMWRKFNQFKSGTNFAAWGVQIMHYLILDYRRKVARNKCVLMKDAVFEALTEHVPTIQDEMAIRIEALRKCQAGLDDQIKRIIRMRFELNTSVEDMAVYLKRSPRQVYRILGQISNILLRCMNKTLAEGNRSI
ncbi:MAG: sigma-70 family RNA polymerase sigma factor [Phycisphaerae bacterium]|nr:sigma-70 family RNA polymerase sigma factor [Phycisphaerae bacterium]